MESFIRVLKAMLLKNCKVKTIDLLPVMGKFSKIFVECQAIPYNPAPRIGKGHYTGAIGCFISLLHIYILYL